VKFLVDECVDSDLVPKLRSEGHDVLYVVEYNPGILDNELLNMAYSEKRILLTEDKDFGELVYRLKKSAFAIVLLRFEVKEKHSHPQFI